MEKNKGKAIGLLWAGFLCSGISCSLYVSCGLGSDAFNVMTQGLSDTLGIRAGNAFYVIQGVMFLLVLALGRRHIGLGTFLGTFLVGFVMNLWSLLLTPLLGAAGFPVRLCCLACAPVFTGLGISLAKRSGLGLVPCDILTLIFHERLHRLQFRTVRILYDGAMFITGLLLGGTIGIGTVLSVLLTGPCIQTAAALLDRAAGKRAASAAPAGAGDPPVHLAFSSAAEQNHGG